MNEEQMQRFAEELARAQKTYAAAQEKRAAEKVVSAKAIRQDDVKTLHLEGAEVVLHAFYYHEEGAVAEYMLSMRVKSHGCTRLIRGSEGLPFIMKQSLDMHRAQTAAFASQPPANALTEVQQERLLDRLWSLTQDARNDLLIDVSLIGKKLSRERLAPLPCSNEKEEG